MGEMPEADHIRFECSNPGVHVPTLLDMLKATRAVMHEIEDERDALQTEIDAQAARLREQDAEIAALRAAHALSAGREEIYRVAIEHIWDEDTPPDYDEHDTGDDQAPSTGSIWAWHAINAADTLTVTMGAAPDFDHQRRLHRERILSRHNYRRAQWPLAAHAGAGDTREGQG